MLNGIAGVRTQKSRLTWYLEIFSKIIKKLIFKIFNVVI